MNDVDALDLVCDLAHDLGKYLALPVTALPADADIEDFRSALRMALRRTRVAGTDVRPARRIWDAFRAETGTAIASREGFAAVAEAVERALAWESVLDGDSAFDVAAARADLIAVGDAIRTFAWELKTHGKTAPVGD